MPSPVVSRRPALPHHRAVLAALAGAVGLSLAGVTPAAATVPGTNGKIAYSEFSSPNRIGAVNPDGSGDAVLIGGTNAAQGPEWSPDATRIAYSRTIGTARDLYLANADGSGEVQLTTDAARDVGPAFSPDGKRIAYIRQVGSDQRARSVRVVNVDGSGDVEIIADAGQDFLGNLDWSPDGERIALYAEPLPESAGGIYLVEPDGTDLTPVVLDDATHNTFWVAWAPDGKRLAYQNFDGTKRDIFLINPDGTGETRLTDSDENEGALEFSPDGTTIAFYSSEGLRTIPVTGGTPTTVKPNPPGGFGGLSWQSLPRTPLATTGAASDVAQTAATLNGSANPQSLAAASTVFFEYGTTTAYGSQTPDVAVPATTSDTPASAGITGLAPGTEYHFRLVARNASGTTFGADSVFTTAAATPPPTQTTPPATTTVVQTPPPVLVPVSPKRLQPRLTSRVTPGRDRRSPYRFTTTGRLIRPAGVTAASGCSGKVRVTFKSGALTVSSRLASVTRSCTYRSQVTFRINRRVRRNAPLKVSVRFAGNGRLLPVRAGVKTVRVR